MRKDERELLEAVANGKLIAYAAEQLGMSPARTRNLVQKWLDFGYLGEGGQLTAEGKALLSNG